MTIDAVLSQLFEYSKPTYFRWKKEQRPIISLIDKYFTKEDLEEFLQSGKIKRFEDFNKYSSIIQSLSNTINNFDYYQKNILYAMCEQFLQDNNNNISSYNFKRYFTVNGFSDLIDQVSYFPDQKKETFYQELLGKKIGMDVKILQAYNVFEEIIKLDDVLFQILFSEYKTLIDIKNDTYILMPNN